MEYKRGMDVIDASIGSGAGCLFRAVADSGSSAPKGPPTIAQGNALGLGFPYQEGAL